MKRLSGIVTLLLMSMVMARKRVFDDIYYDDVSNSNEFSTKYISLEGTIRRSFALIAAVDNQDKNMICSPLSALLPLGKLAIGAQDEALQELLTAIGVSKKSKLKSHFTPLIEDLKYLPGVQLDIASNMYVSKSVNLLKKFQDRSRIIFNSSVGLVDFGRPKEAADTINTWVSKNTNGMIKDLISPREISRRTSLVMVNAIYFSGQWKVPFKVVNNGTFHTPTGDKKVPMMMRYAWLNYRKSKTLGAQLVEIPYVGTEASFIILLPYKKNGLPALLSQLKIAPELLDSELNKMEKIKVMLTMPKFKMETQLDLLDLYKKIGLSEIFKQYNSGLIGIVVDQSVFVSNAKQKAVIEVTEYGSEAAASSLTQFVGVSLDIHRERIDCFHPFLFYIRANKQQLFAGILNYP